MSRDSLWEELALWAHPCILAAWARSEGGPVSVGDAVFRHCYLPGKEHWIFQKLFNLILNIFFSFGYRIALVGSKTITLKDWDVKDARSPDLGIRAASDAGIGGSGAGRNDHKREPGKMGGVGSWHLLSCSPTHLLVLEWVCSGIQLSIEIFFSFFLFGLHVLTKDSHIELLRPWASSAAGSMHFCLVLGKEWAGWRTSRKGRAPQQRTWSPNEAFSVWVNQQNPVYSIRNHLGNQQNQRNLTF